MHPVSVSGSSRLLMRGNRLTEQNSGSRFGVTDSIGIECACRGKKLEGKKQELCSIDTNRPRAKYEAH